MSEVGYAALLGVALIAGSIGFFAAWLGRASALQTAEALRGEIGRLEAQVREQTRQLGKHQQEQRWLSSLSRRLPDVVRDLNRNRPGGESRDLRDLSRHVFSLLDSIFEPERMLVYLVRSPGDRGGSPMELYLADQRGYPELPAVARRVRVGVGRVGWVAQQKVEMAADDWLNLTRTEGHALEDNHPLLRLDLIAPIVHHHEGKEELFGVVCLGSPAIRPRDEKLMIQMVTNLAAIAIDNANNVRKLEEQANHDGLTGLFNKRFFLKKRLGEVINGAEREGQTVGLFIFDIDHFKHYNDTNGHVEGDEVLRDVALVLKENLRVGDVACRYGGEEFVVAMPQADGAETMRVAERIRVAIEAHVFAYREKQPAGRVTISGGVAVFPMHGTEGQELIRRADQALYQAKREGRNRIVLHRDVHLGFAGDSPIPGGGWEAPRGSEPAS